MLIRRTRKDHILTLAALEVVLEDVAALALRAVLLDDDARAADDLARVALAVDLAEAGPGAEHLGVTDLYNVMSVRAVHDP